MELNACAGAEFGAADAELNWLYKRITARLGADKAPLVAAQRAWIAYRDESCRYEALRYQGGSIAGVVRARCLQELTARQALRLRALAEQEG